MEKEYGTGAFSQGPADAVIRMRGLPFSATREDLVEVCLRPRDVLLFKPCWQSSRPSLPFTCKAVFESSVKYKASSKQFA